MPAPTDVRYSKYPTGDDVADKLRSSKLWPFEENDQARALDQANLGAHAVASQWERRSGYSPFLSRYASAVPQARPFANIERDGTLQFRAACTSIVSVAFGATTYIDADYELLFGEELAYQPPYTGIRFFRGRGHYASSVPHTRTVVTATWGYCDRLDPYVWQQCQQAGALIALTSVENLQNISSIGQDGFNKAFDVVGVISQTLLLQTWGKDFLQAVSQYRRDVVF